MNIISWLPPVILLSILLGVVDICYGDDDPDPTVDAIEQILETGRHQKLLDRIAQSGTNMTDFTTDGCSGGLSAGWEYLSGSFPEMAEKHGELPPWESCCIEHDIKYHAGGEKSVTAAESFEQRKQADLALLSCVANTASDRSPELQDEYELSETQVAAIYQSIAELMYRAVRLGGMPCSDQPWRWGYGWPECR